MVLPFLPASGGRKGTQKEFYQPINVQKMLSSCQERGQVAFDVTTEGKMFGVESEPQATEQSPQRSHGSKNHAFLPKTGTTRNG